jgi:hypothetical protein
VQEQTFTQAAITETLAKLPGPAELESGRHRRRPLWRRALAVAGFAAASLLVLAALTLVAWWAMVVARMSGG